MQMVSNLLVQLLFISFIINQDAHVNQHHQSIQQLQFIHPDLLRFVCKLKARTMRIPYPSELTSISKSFLISFFESAEDGSIFNKQYFICMLACSLQSTAILFSKSRSVYQSFASYHLV